MNRFISRSRFIRTCRNLFVFTLVFCLAVSADVYAQIGPEMHDTTRTRKLFSLGEKVHVNQPDSALKLWEQSKMLAEQAMKKYSRSSPEFRALRSTFAACLNNIGYVTETRGNMDQARAFYEQALKIHSEIGDESGVATSLTNIGYVLVHQGEIKKGMEHYHRALKIREKTGDKVGIAETLNNIGNVFYNQDDTGQALDYWIRCSKIQEEAKDIGGLSITLNNIGALYSKTGHPKKALEYYRRSLALYEQSGDKRAMASTINNIGALYLTIGDPDITCSEAESKKAGLEKAFENFKMSLQINQEISNKPGVATSWLSVGYIYFLQKDYRKSLECTNNGMALAKELGAPDIIKKAAERLMHVHKASGNYKLALENFELCIRMRDSINNAQTQKAAIRQQAEYEYEKKKAVEDERHATELKLQEEKARAAKKKQNIIIGCVSLVLLLVAIFSALLYNRFRTTKRQKAIIEVKEKETTIQKHIIEEKQKEIIDSINYARRIQYTLLANDEFLKQHLTSFTFFKPKDIVSGDFYWAARQRNRFYLAVCDSTGHGVPGAFMSLLNIGFLSEAINEKEIVKPNEIFDFVRAKLIHSISRDGQRDGFDGILLCIDMSDGRITYAAANNAPVLVTENGLTELGADRMPVGIGERAEPFSLHEIDRGAKGMLYLYTDGYADQFGGPKGKKFKYRQLNDLLQLNYDKPLAEQNEALKMTFDAWKGDLEQVDDVCLIGIRL